MNWPLAPDNSPSLYLVSDGHGVITPPHEHKTWVIIAGYEVLKSIGSTLFIPQNLESCQRVPRWRLALAKHGFFTRTRSIQLRS